MIARIIFVLLALMLSSTVRAANEIHVKFTYSGGSTSTDLWDAGATITYTGIDNTVDYINIWADPTSASIGLVQLSGTATQEIDVKIGSSAWNGTDTTHSTAAQNWAGLSPGSTGFRDILHLEGKIGGNLTGAVAVGRSTDSTWRARSRQQSPPQLRRRIFSLSNAPRFPPPVA